MIKYGEKPGIGVYICKKCGAALVIDDPDTALYPCPQCYHCEFTQA